MAQYQLSERTYWNLRIMEAGEIIEVPDETIPGKTWIPFGPGPHREWEPQSRRTETERDTH
jgi:hypothetical protein